MTIYSGFATRKLQQKYNNILTQIIELLSQLVITYVQHNKIQPFQKKYRRLFHNIQKLDSLKHLQPKYSQILQPLSEHIFLQDDKPVTMPQQFKQKQRDSYKDNATVNANSINDSHYKNHKIKRPMTSNNFVVQQHDRRHSIQMQRKTINVLPERSKSRKKTIHIIQTFDSRYDKQQNKKFRHQSFTVKKASENIGNYLNVYSSKNSNENNEYRQERQNGNNLTMEELMQKNRLIQRKMTLFRKKKPIHNKISKIPQLEQEEDAQFI